MAGARASFEVGLFRLPRPISSDQPGNQTSCSFPLFLPALVVERKI